MRVCMRFCTGEYLSLYVDHRYKIGNISFSSLRKACGSQKYDNLGIGERATLVKQCIGWTEMVRAASDLLLNFFISKNTLNCTNHPISSLEHWLHMLHLSILLFTFKQ